MSYSTTCDITVLSQIPNVDLMASNILLNEKIETTFKATDLGLGLLLGTISKCKAVVVETVTITKGNLPAPNKLLDIIQKNVANVNSFSTGGLHVLGFYIMSEDDYFEDVPQSDIANSIFQTVNQYYPSEYRPLFSDVIAFHTNSLKTINSYIYRCDPCEESLHFERQQMTYSIRGLWGEIVPMSSIVNLSLTLPITRPSDVVIRSLLPDVISHALISMNWSSVTINHIKVLPRIGTAMYNAKPTSIPIIEPQSDKEHVVTFSLPLRAYTHSSATVSSSLRSLKQDLIHSLIALMFSTYTINSLSRAWARLAICQSICLSILGGGLWEKVSDGARQHIYALDSWHADANPLPGRDMAVEFVRRRGKQLSMDMSHSQLTKSQPNTPASSSLEPPFCYWTYPSALDGAKNISRVFGEVLLMVVDEGDTPKLCRRVVVGKEAVEHEIERWKTKIQQSSSKVITEAVKQKNSWFKHIDVNYVIFFASVIGFLISYIITGLVEIN